ncbi:MAG TPA: universal stress protein [Caldimonas sp.]|nr:universal stress protein [Caldimonas sp.]
MFKHILVPTDGSPLAEAAAIKSIELAVGMGAKITAVAVVPRFHVLTFHADLLEATRAECERAAAEHAERALAFVRKAAADRGVACELQQRVSDEIDATILEIAHDRGCDVIAMATHGRRAIAGALLGSVTQRVLTHARMPVLVWR